MTKENNLIRSFGRIKCRQLSAAKQDLIDNILPQYEIQIKENQKINPSSLFDANITQYNLEIGFGYGDFLSQKLSNQNQGFIACETHVNGIAAFLNKINKPRLHNNLKIYSNDVRILLESLENNSLDQIYILFPDPWPKVKHHKRRLINQDFLNILSTKLKSKGRLLIVSDHDDYQSWIIKHLHVNKNFSWLAKNSADFKNPPTCWPSKDFKTKYQQKAALKNHQIRYFLFQNEKN